MGKFNLEIIKNGNENQKKAFMLAYFMAKADEIITNIREIKSSREKDDQCFRWRYAINKADLYDFELMQSRILELTQQIKRADINDSKFIKLAAELDRLSNEYDKKTKEIAGIREELKRTEAYDIDLNDLSLFFEKIVELYKKFDEDLKEMISIYYMQTINCYSIEENNQSVFGQ